jgi:hypothetical protein
MTDTPRPFETLREAQRIGRNIFVEGVPWLVYELPPMVFDRRNSPSLVFETDGTVRRVRDYPPNWRELSDDELFALSWSA